MAKGFSIDDVLGDQSKVTRPAGTRMDIVMLPIGDIVANPENAIYEIGDVGMLQADIAEHGLRTPLEVTPAGGKYMLVAGHRRHTACLGLHDGGDPRFDRLPCIVVNYNSQDEELVALITSNATARELTDGERLRQYEALKGALTRLKAAGKVDGRVRDELSRRTGEGTGTLGRLNAISARCIPEVKEMLARGEITMTRAYECSKLYKVQQVMYAKNGYSSMPRFTRKKEQERWYNAAQEELHRFDEWKKVAQAKELGLIFREYVFLDGGRMVVAVDEESRNKAVTGLPYDYYFGVRFGADGTRVHRDSGEKTDIKFFTKWDWKPELALRIAEDLQARARAESD